MSYTDLKFIRGFVISESEVRTPNVEKWERLHNQHYFFYFDNHTNWKYIENGDTWGCIIGHCIDPYHKTDDLSHIIQRSVNHYTNSLDQFYDYHETLVGRFVFILGKGKNTTIVADATAMKSVFYHPHQPIISSHAKLLSEITGEGLDSIVSLKWLSSYTNYHLPGHFTPFQNVYYLLPNHALSWPSHEITRYFPREPLNFDNFNEKFEEIIENTKNQLELLTKKNNFIFSLSAGMDSRTSLSFMQDYLNQTNFFTYYFTDSTDPTYKGSSILNLDQKIVNDIARNLKLNHTFIPIDRANEKNDDFQEFKEIIKENTFLNHSANLARNYLQRFGTDNYLHIRSTLYEIGRPVLRNKYKFKDNVATLEDLVTCYSPKALGDEKVVHLMKQHEQLYNVNNVFNYDPFDLIYWEKRMGTWHSQILIQSDVSHNTHIFMNSHRLLKLMLSLPMALRKSGELFTNIIENNWPILRFWDINNDRTLIDKFDAAKERYGLKLEKMVIESGNDNNHDSVVPFAYRKSEKSAHFFIDKNAPLKGDYVEAVIDIPTKKDKSQDIVLQIRSSFENPKNKGRLKYQVFLNNQLKVEEDIAFWGETNQIIIPNNDSSTQLKIRVVAVKNCEEWNWGRAGTIFIERVNVRTGNSLGKIQASSPFTKLL